MVAGMNTRRYKQASFSLLLFFLMMPAHGWATRQSGNHDVAYSVDLVLAQAQDNEKGRKRNKEEYRLKKSRHQKNNARYEHQRNKYMSLKESASRVKNRMNGKVLSAHSYEEDGHSYHRIKILTPDGVVRIILVDPESGDMD